ncbi:hypothetical protein [Streptomyces sp. NBC_01760]|uniref:hypothetical protein n=1 Tax=Streptomyces sp. NBC_01760 TaxID=2975931 RepID=UPI002DD7ADAD|nr:hypothetical protein [Streptomyces sp. NBC_01760]WSC72098.1 hypothetical protein OG807_28520 [Streptomyces sp. NBC_01760]
MIDLEVKINQVWHQEVRPLVAEAYRCYTMGSARASIVVTWTAVCADLIHKLHQLAEDGEGEAAAVVKKIDSAREKPDDKQAVRTMQEVENSLLDIAERLELVDFVQKRELERLKEDRNLAAHPSLRPLGELFTPTTEYARAHLAAAIEALLIHPPSQGRKARDRFRDYVDDPAFVGSAAFLRQAFFDRVKSGTQRSIVSLAAKHALLELSTPGPLSDTLIADRYARCLRAFAERGRELVHQEIAANVTRLAELPLDRQIRALVRLGDLDVLWDAIDSAMRVQIEAYLRQISVPDYQPMTVDQLGALGLVELESVRLALPSLEEKFRALSFWQQSFVIARRPGPYVSGYVAGILKAAGSFRTAETVAQNTVPHCAPHLTAEQLSDILGAWAENYECRAAMGMVDLAVSFYSLVPETLRKHSAWQEFLDRVRAEEEEDSFFRYTELERAMGSAGVAGKPA